MLNCNQSQQVKTMKNYYLKFESQAELEATLIAAGLGTKNDDIFVSNYPLDIIGVIHRPTGGMVTTEDGFEYPETTTIEGYHANLLAELTADQEDDLPIIDVNNPVRKWAGE
jgi:hypothetical protein